MHRGSDSRASRAGKTRQTRCWLAFASVGLMAVFSAGCGDKTPPPPPVCERECQDTVALRALREMMKYAFNHTFQTKPVGMHDLTTDRFLGGTARVFGTAFSDGLQGVTDVDLTYVFTQAAYVKKEDDAEENYIMGLDGTITQVGKIAVQPSSSTALKMKSEAVSLLGTVYDPPINYTAFGCALEILQNGNSVAGMFCGHWVGFNF
jgi:hypothetical protein